MGDVGRAPGMGHHSRSIDQLAEALNLEPAVVGSCLSNAAGRSGETIDTVIAILHRHYSIDQLSRLPHEIALLILNDVDVKDLISLCSTSRHLQTICDDQYFWSILLRRDFGLEEQGPRAKEVYKIIGRWRYNPCSLIVKDEEETLRRVIDAAFQTLDIVKFISRELLLMMRDAIQSCAEDRRSLNLEADWEQISLDYVANQMCCAIITRMMTDGYFDEIVSQYLHESPLNESAGEEPESRNERMYTLSTWMGEGIGTTLFIKGLTTKRQARELCNKIRDLQFALSDVGDLAIWQIWNHSHIVISKRYQAVVSGEPYRTDILYNPLNNPQDIKGKEEIMGIVNEILGV